VEEIDFEKLPKQFVLKCTHDCGSVVICKDKENFDFEAAKEKLGKALKRNWYWEAREWAYKNMVPKITAEQLLSGVNGEIPADYKIHCFAGKPLCIQLITERFKDVHESFYDPNWNLLPFTVTYPPTSYSMQRPSSLSKMLEIAESLSAGFPYMRIDLYAMQDGSIFFGEMTVYPAGGFLTFKPKAYDLTLGKEWKI
jgi:hypothetical protein